MRRPLRTIRLAIACAGICIPSLLMAQAAPNRPNSAPTTAPANRGGDDRQGGRDDFGGREGRRGPFGGDFTTLPIFKALDTNGDGELSAEEIDNAPRSLLTLDKNKDGKLSREELLGDMGGGRRGEGGRGRGEGGRGRGEGGRGEGEQSGPTAAELVAQLMAFDRNGDGKLSKDELPERMQNLIDRADTNKDGFVDREELTRYAEQQVRGSQGNGRGPGGPGPRGGGPPMLPILQALDTDGDGELSASEIANAAAALRTLDKNKDGKLTRDELFGDMNQGRRGRGGFGPGPGGGGPRQ